MSDRIKENSVTALSFGEIIGFSKNVNEIFTAWLNSDSHTDVIEDPRWNLVGVSVLMMNSTYVSVITFSSGNLKSVKFSEINGVISITGGFIDEPIFKSNNKVLDFKINREKKTFNFSSLNNKIIQVYNRKNRLTDRIELFF